MFFEYSRLTKTIIFSTVDNMIQSGKVFVVTSLCHLDKHARIPFFLSFFFFAQKQRLKTQEKVCFPAC